jgi:hypothetical protein
MLRIGKKSPLTRAPDRERERPVGGPQGCQAHLQWHVERENGRGLALFCGLGRHGESGPRRKKNPFSFSNDFFKYRNEINSGKIFTDLKNTKFCMEVDLNIWHNFYIGNFDQR